MEALNLMNESSSAGSLNHFVPYETENSSPIFDNSSSDADGEVPGFSQQPPFDGKNSPISFQVPTGLVVLLSLLYGSISLAAVIGNALVMWIVASSKNMHSVTNYFIANLAFADIIIGLFSIPFQFQAALLQRWNLPYFMCAMCPFVQTVSVNVSVFTLTAIAVDRYRAIVHPLVARPSKFRSKVAIFSIWSFGIVLAVPNAIALRIDMVGDGYSNYKPVCSPINLDPVFMQTYMHLLVGVQYFLPLGIISYAYIRIAWQLWGTQTPGNAEDTRDAHMLKNKKKVVKMLFIVVAIFALCWAPLQAYYIIQEIYPPIAEVHYINYIWFASHWLAMSNSSCNPFIYAIYNEKFKREFRYKFRFLFRRGENEVDKSGNHEFGRSTRLTATSAVSYTDGRCNHLLAGVRSTSRKMASKTWTNNKNFDAKTSVPLAALMPEQRISEPTSSDTCV